MGLVDGEGPLSLSVNRKVNRFLCSSSMHVLDLTYFCSDCMCFFLFVGSILCGGGCRRRGSVSVALLNGDGALFDGTLRFAKVTLLFHVLQ